MLVDYSQVFAWQVNFEPLFKINFDDFPISELENLSNPKEMQKMQLHI